MFQFVLAGFSLPILGYFVAWFLSGAFKLQKEDRLSVALSTVNIHSVIAMKLFDFYTRKSRQLAVLFPLTAVMLSPMPVLIHFAYRKYIVKKLWLIEATPVQFNIIVQFNYIFRLVFYLICFDLFLLCLRIVSSADRTIH